MKLPSLFIITAQATDIMTTLIGINHFNAIELHPLGFTWQTVLLKVLATLAVVYVVERYNFSKKIMIVPWIVALVCVWNVVNILAECI
jgi:hypothetical protein